MNKKEVLQRLRAAKSAHLQWRARAQALVSGIEVDSDKIPMIHTDCKFGQWYYGDAQNMVSLSSFQAIEEPHKSLHTIYMSLFNVLHGEDKRSGWQKLFGKKSSFEAKQLERANVYLNELIETSKILLAAIDLFENEVKAMSDETVKAFHHT